MNPLISEYVLLAKEHGEWTLKGDSRHCNRDHHLLMRIIEAIKGQSAEIKNEFYEQMNSADVSVRIGTAVTLLKTFEPEALNVLRKIGEQEATIHSLEARTMIDCWNNGTLTNLVDWNGKSNF